MIDMHINEQNLTEQEIKENWQSPDIQVSIVCTAYNHEPYIRDAIEGFLSQKTNFAFEIIIHDDASTDETPNIIMDYHRRFPTIIIPILQKENQHSKETKIFSTFINPIIRGKYIAHCEGDDYWIDPEKLQKQFDALEENQTCDICFHPAKAMYPNGTSRIMCLHSKSNIVFPIGDVILGDGGFMPTASLFYRKEIRTSVDAFFERYGKFPVGDVMLQFLASKRGGALYLPMIGSVYRVNSIGSWSSRTKNDSNYAKYVRKKTILWNEKLNEFTNYEYDYFFRKKITRILLNYITNPYMEKDERLYYFQNYSSYLDYYSRIRLQSRFLLRNLKKFAKQTLLKYSR
jgi:glycosyltransferase involved in cell wall biosynthesis